MNYRMIVNVRNEKALPEFPAGLDAISFQPRRYEQDISGIRRSWSARGQDVVQHSGLSVPTIHLASMTDTEY
jgi:hypothetical protein